MDFKKLLEDQANQPIGAFVDDSGGGPTEFGADVLGQAHQFGGEAVPDQVVDGFPKNITLPQLLRSGKQSKKAFLTESRPLISLQN